MTISSLYILSSHLAHKMMNEGSKVLCSVDGLEPWPPNAPNEKSEDLRQSLGWELWI